MCKKTICPSKDDEKLKRETLSFDTMFRDMFKQQIENENKRLRELVEKLGYVPKEIVIERYPLTFEKRKDGSVIVCQNFKIRYKDKKGAMKYFERNKNKE